MTTRVALVVGIDHYGDQFDDLDYCVADAEAVAAALSIENYDFDVRELLDGAATRAAITKQLLELRDADAQMVLFYFAGHGATDATGTYLVSADGAPFDLGIEISRLVDMLSPVDSDSVPDVVVLLDCCNAGAAALPATAITAIKGLDEARVTKAFERSATSNKAVLGASLVGEAARESAEHRQGVFTQQVIDGLIGGAADHNGSVTLTSLYDFVSKALDSSHGQTPFFYSALAGMAPLGDGLEPRLAPPIETDELANYCRVASELVQSHRRLRVSEACEDWEGRGFRAAAVDLAHAVIWFERALGRFPQLQDNPSFKKSWLRMQQYRADLGSITPHTVTPVGRTIERLGQGSFGTVWKVEDDSGSAVAYKAYHPNDLNDVNKSSRFRRGYDAMGKLDHPRIVKVHRYTDAPLGFTMDYVAGSNVRELNPGGYFEPVDVVFLLIAIAEAIAHAHDSGVVHRDIKPENIVCSYDSGEGRWSPMLTDFDLAWINTGTQVTHEGIGNLLYAAPEQFINFSKRAVSGFYPTLDVYSFGQLAYFCVTGSDPSPTNAAENRSNFRERLGAWPSQDAAAQMTALYERATEAAVRDRTGKMSEVLDELRDVQSSLGPAHLEHLDIGHFLAELRFAFVGTTFAEVPEGMREVQFESTSGQTYIDARGRTGDAPDTVTATLLLTPKERVGWDGVPNQILRNRLNQRVGKALGEHPGAEWRHGKTGNYQVYVDLKNLPLDASGLGRARRAVTDVLVKLEQV